MLDEEKRKTVEGWVNDLKSEAEALNAEAAGHEAKAKEARAKAAADELEAEELEKIVGKAEDETKAETPSDPNSDPKPAEGDKPEAAEDKADGEPAEHQPETVVL